MKNIFLALYLLLCSHFIIAQNNLHGNQRAYYECSDSIYNIDTTIIKVLPNKVYFQFNTTDTLTKTQLESFHWLKHTKADFFSCYLINTTDSTFNASRQDMSLIMIQEALDKDGNWQPIEYWVYSGCGNSYFYPLELIPNTCVLVPIIKYTGDYETKIRLKFKYDKKVIYSTSFNGSIQKSQFKKESKTVNGILYHGPANYLND